MENQTLKEKHQLICSVIIVTHNSQAYLGKCLASLKGQTLSPDRIVIVDSGSQQKEYLQIYEEDPLIHLCLLLDNVGFCRGNNIGMAAILPQSDYVLFLNPDAFLTPTFLEQALEYLEAPSHARVGALTGVLLGYDIKKDQPTGNFDSTGVFQEWYGRWYDRGQGEPYQMGLYSEEEKVPALCGALMLCRKKALDDILLSPYEVMDSTFYMYKEDIDLSLRLRRQGWSLIFLPHLIAYHCRGWQKDRKQVPHHLRLLSAKNEMRLHARLYSPYFIYSMLKYILVKVFNF
jgi:N-acetylglucosaminyl-diphospho-decaprenol L-rhamnosyltransferase